MMPWTPVLRASRFPEVVPTLAAASAWSATSFRTSSSDWLFLTFTPCSLRKAIESSSDQSSYAAVARAGGSGKACEVKGREAGQSGTCTARHEGGHGEAGRSIVSLRYRLGGHRQEGLFRSRLSLPKSFASAPNERARVAQTSVLANFMVGEGL